MSTYTIKRKNGCAVKYSESPLKLPNGEIVPFKIEGILQPDGVNDEEMCDFLKDVENKLDTIIVAKTQVQGVFPHFYIDCPYPDKADMLVGLFNMSYVEAHGIMLYPADNQLRLTSGDLFFTHLERRTSIDPERAVHGHAYSYTAGDR